jgi:Ca2+-binding RTX toxin-like protein
MSTRAIQACCATLVLSLGSVPVAARAGSSAETCFGEPATIVQHGPEPVHGTDGPDVIVATSDASVHAYRGDDLICAAGGIWAGRGDDRVAKRQPPEALRQYDVRAGPGDDVVYRREDRNRQPHFYLYTFGGPGSDLLHGGWNMDFIRGGAGDDVVTGGARWDSVRGGDGDDLVRGGGRGDHVRGGPGADLLRGGPHRDQLGGGPGPDQMYGGGDRDEARGDEGDDHIDLGPGGGDHADGGDGVDTCFAEEVSGCEVP